MSRPKELALQVEAAAEQSKVDLLSSSEILVFVPSCGQKSSAHHINPGGHTSKRRLKTAGLGGSDGCGY